MLTRFEDGTGLSAYKVTNDKVSGRYAFITDLDGGHAPANLDTDPMLIGFYHDGISGSYELHKVDGRQGFIDLVTAQRGGNNLAEFLGIPSLKMVEHCASLLLLKEVPKPVAAVPEQPSNKPASVERAKDVTNS